MAFLITTPRVALEAALSLARKGCGKTRPNPPVGAVIVYNGNIIGRGWHRRCGGDHAEVAAIKDALRQLKPNEIKRVLAKSTLYVTLEPCSRPGRVGACTDAIIKAGIGEVVYGAKDPNPINRNRAKRVLKHAGIACRYERIQECEELIAPFAKFITTGKPYITVKIAMSLDGRICDDFGNAKWISSEVARHKTGRLRSQVDAIMVGAETIRKDNPSLLCHEKRNDDLIRVVISRSGDLPKNAQVFTDGKNTTLVFGDAVSAVTELGKMGVVHILCEGGLNLATSLAEAGLVDEWIAVIAPKVIGHGKISEAVRIPKMTCLPD